MNSEDSTALGSLDVESLLSALKHSAESELISYRNLDFFRTDLLEERLHLLNSQPNKSIYDLARFRNANRVFSVDNRKYLGSKDRLLDFLESIVIAKAGTCIHSFFDVFAGTGVVANHFRKYARKVIANDILYSNYVANSVFLCSSRQSVSVEKVQSIIDYLNEAKPARGGYISSNYSGTYFTRSNALKMDQIREKIEFLFRTKQCSSYERDVLLVSLLYAIDKVANTVGQYDAFLKGIGSRSYVEGKHKIDSNVYHPISLKRPFIFFDGVNESYNEDANQLADRVVAEVAYLDPPYNHRQYVDCYHLLENISKWSKPALHGKTKKFDREHLKSQYSTRKGALRAFEDLIGRLKCQHIFLSYNSEGILSPQEIRTILAKRGRVEIYQTDYNVFGNGAGVSKKRILKERLYYCSVKQ